MSIPSQISIDKRNSEVSELELYFKSAKLPEGEMMLNDSATIKNIPLFISSHLSIIKANMEAAWVRPDIDRLHKLKEKLETKDYCKTPSVKNVVVKIEPNQNTVVTNPSITKEPPPKKERNPRAKKEKSPEPIKESEVTNTLF